MPTATRTASSSSRRKQLTIGRASSQSLYVVLKSPRMSPSVTVPQKILSECTVGLEPVIVPKRLFTGQRIRRWPSWSGPRWQIWVKEWVCWARKLQTWIQDLLRFKTKSKTCLSKTKTKTKTQQFQDQKQDQDFDVQDQDRDLRLRRPIQEVNDWDGLWKTKRLKKSWEAENPAYW